MVEPTQLNGMNAQELRELARGLLAQLISKDGELSRMDVELSRKENELVRKDQELLFKQTKIDQLTHEMAVLKRMKFASSSERLSAEQRSLLDETIDADLAAIEQELSNLQGETTKPATEKSKPRRAPLPPHLPRVDVRHEPESELCGCGCRMRRIGEDVSEKLDYTPGTFSVERHVRGTWSCAQCETIVQAPVPAQVIDKGIPTAGLLAQVLVAKYADHNPLHRQEGIFARAGLALPRSTLAQWVGACGVQLQPLVDALRAEVLSHGVMHADETPVAMLAPGTGKTHRAYLWAYSPGVFEPLKAVVYDFTESRAGSHARAFLGHWQGKLVCDDYAGYKNGFAQGITEVGCMAHARRKFFELHAANKSVIAGRALEYIGMLYEIEREVRELGVEDRLERRQARARPVVDALHAWMLAQRSQVPDGTATASALDYSLKRWAALTRYVDDGQLPIDNNWIENQIRPIAIGRNNWLFAGSLRAGQRAAAIMSLIQSAKLNGLEPHAYLKDVLTRLPTHKASRVGELLPHRWVPSAG